MEIIVFFAAFYKIQEFMFSWIENYRITKSMIWKVGSIFLGCVLLLGSVMYYFSFYY